MALLNVNLATRGMDAATRFKILKRHLFSFLRHLTVKKIMNFVSAELNLRAKKDVVTSYPYILKIESTNVCNLECAYCYDGRRKSEEGERPYGRMTFERFKKLVDEVGPYLFKINLYGFGEAFLFPEAYEMIAYATKNNIGVGVSSNMNIKDPEFPKKIVESGLEVLIFSCHGVSQESYEKFMIKGDRDLAFKNIKAVIEERKKAGSKTPLIDWQYCVTGFNQAEIEDAKKTAKELGIDQVRFIKPFFPEGADDEWFSNMFPKNMSEEPGSQPTGCSWPYRSAYISFDGRLLPCCKDDRNLEHDFGNVIDEGFMKVWNNEKYTSSRRLLANPRDKSIQCDTICADCPLTKVDD